MPMWVGDGVASKRPISDLRVGDGVASKRPVSKAWIGDSSGVPRLVYQRVPDPPDPPDTQQKTVTLDAMSSASFNGSNANRNVAEMYCGYYSASNGRQSSLHCVNVPNDLRNCVSVDKVEIAFYCVHHYQSAGGLMQVNLHHSDYRSGFSATRPGSTQPFIELAAPKPGWLGGGLRWVDVTNLKAPGRTPTIANEFRTQAAWGFGLAAPNDSHQYYGYCAGAGQSNAPQVRFTYTVEV